MNNHFITATEYILCFLIAFTICYKQVFSPTSIGTAITKKMPRFVIKGYKQLQFNFAFLATRLESFLGGLNGKVGVILIILICIFMISLVNFILLNILGEPIGYKEVLDCDYDGMGGSDCVGTGSYEKCNYWGVSSCLLLLLSSVLYNSRYFKYFKQKKSFKNALL